MPQFRNYQFNHTVKFINTASIILPFIISGVIVCVLIGVVIYPLIFIVIKSLVVIVNSTFGILVVLWVGVA